MANKITLTDITTGFNLANINSNFDAIEDYINNESLSRSNPLEATNQLEVNLDANSNQLDNLAAPDSASQAATKAYVDGLLLSDPGTVTTVVESQIATAGQTAFTLSTATYTPGANNLDVYVNGVHQNPSGYAETSSGLVTLSGGLAVGDNILFKVNQRTASGDTIVDANVTYTPAGDDAVARTVRAKLREVISISDFGVAGDGSTDDLAKIQAAVDYCATLTNGAILVLNNESYAISDPIAMKQKVSIYGQGPDQTIIVPDNDKDAFTWAFTQSFGISAVENLMVNPGAASEGYAFHQPGTEDQADELYGLRIRNVLVNNMSLMGHFRTIRKAIFEDVWAINSDGGLHLVGKCLNSQIKSCWFTYGAGAGATMLDGVLLDVYDYDTGGQIRPEAIRMTEVSSFGYDVGFKINDALYTNITGCDVQANTHGIWCKTVAGGLVIDDNYIAMDDTGSLYGILLNDQNSVIDTQVSVRNNRIVAADAHAATTSVGIAVGFSGTGNFDNFIVEGNSVKGHTKYDILVSASGIGAVRNNYLYSTASSGSIYFVSVPSNRTVHVYENDCYSTIAYDDDNDFINGDVIEGTNIQNQTTVTHGQAGTPTTPTFAAGDYTSDSGTWVLTAGDVTKHEWTLDGNMLTMHFDLVTTTITGTPSELRIDLPGTRTAASVAMGTFYYDENGTDGVGVCSVAASGTYMILKKTGGANWAAATDTTAVHGQFTFKLA